MGDSRQALTPRPQAAGIRTPDPVLSVTCPQFIRLRLPVVRPVVASLEVAMSSVLATADVWSGADTLSPMFGSYTINFPTADVVATVALSSFYLQGEPRPNEYQGMLNSAETWIDQRRGFEPHLWSRDAQAWFTGVRSVTFWIVTRRGYAAAVGIVHGDRVRAYSDRIGDPIRRALIDPISGAVHRLHTEITLAGAQVPDIAEIDRELSLPPDGISAEGLRCVEVDIKGPGRAGPSRLRYDARAGRVVALPLGGNTSGDDAAGGGESRRTPGDTSR